MRLRPLLAAALALVPVLLASLVRAATEPAASPGAGPGASAAASAAPSGAVSASPVSAGWVAPSESVVPAAAPTAPVVGPPPVSSGVQIFVRTGVSMPLGRFSATGNKVTDGIEGAIPLIVDVGGKPFDRFFVGAYLGFNPGLVGKQAREFCTGGVSCAANNVRLGLEVQFHLFPTARYNPWVGVGFGIEATTLSVDSNDSTTDGSQSVASKAGAGSYQGPEFLHLMGGFDNRLSETFGFGPFIALTVGRYETITSRSSVGVNRTLAIGSPSTHEWLMAGLRLVLFP